MMHSKRLRSIILCAFILIADTAIADTQKSVKMKEVVVIGSRHKKDVRQQPGKFRVIHQKVIFQTQPDSVAQAISDSEAGNMVQVGSPAFNSFELNGFSGRRVILLEEGLRVDTQRSIGPTGSFMPIFDIQRIEVLRGAASFAYGSGGMGGAINVIYQDPWQRQGLHGAAGAHFHTNNLMGGAWARSHYAAKKWFVKAYTGYDHAGDYKNGDKTVKFSAYQNLLAGGSIGYKPASGHRLKLRFESQVARMGKPATQDDIAKNRFTRFPKDDDYRGTAGYLFQRHNTRLEAKTAFNWTGRRFQVSDNKGIVHGTKEFTSWQVSGFLQMRQRLTKHNDLTAGIDIFHTAVSMSQIKKGKEKRIMDGDHQDLIGVFVIDEHHPTQKLNLIAGIRYEMGITSAGLRTDVLQSAVSGSFGWSYKVTRLARFYMTYGEAFRIPTIKETAAIMPTPIGIFRGNPDLRPERSRELQAGIDGKNKWISYGLNVFYTMATDMITLQACNRSDCDYTYVNMSAADIIGVDSRIKAQIPLGRGMDLVPMVKVTYEYGMDPSTWGPVPQIPPLMLNGSIFLKGHENWHNLHWSIGGGITSALQQDRIVSGMETALWQTGPTPGYNLFWAQADIKFAGFGKGNVFEVLARIENIANIKYRNHLSANPGFGRNIKIALRTLF